MMHVGNGVTKPLCVSSLSTCAAAPLLLIVLLLLLAAAACCCCLLLLRAVCCCAAVVCCRGEYGRLGISDRTGSSKLRPHKVWVVVCVWGGGLLVCVVVVGGGGRREGQGGRGNTQPSKFQQTVVVRLAAL